VDAIDGQCARKSTKRPNKLSTSDDLAICVQEREMVVGTIVAGLQLSRSD